MLADITVQCLASNRVPRIVTRLTITMSEERNARSVRWEGDACELLLCRR